MTSELIDNHPSATDRGTWPARVSIALIALGWLFVGAVGPLASAAAWMGTECYSGVCPGPTSSENAALLVTAVIWLALPVVVSVGLWNRNRWCFVVTCLAGVAGAVESLVGPLGSPAFSFWFLTLPGMGLIVVGGVRAISEKIPDNNVAIQASGRSAATYVALGAIAFVALLWSVVFGPGVLIAALLALGILLVAITRRRSAGSAS